MKTLYYRIKLWLIGWIESLVLAIQMKNAERKVKYASPEAVRERQLEAGVKNLTEAVINAALWALTKLALLIFLLTMIVKVFVFFTGASMDSTDYTYKDRWGLTHVGHSGMTVKTDWGTGCQFIEDRKGRLTPRKWETKEGEQLQVCVNVSSVEDFKLLHRLGDDRYVSAWTGDNTDEITGSKMATKTTVVPPQAAPAPK